MFFLIRSPGGFFFFLQVNFLLYGFFEGILAKAFLLALHVALIFLWSKMINLSGFSLSPSASGSLTSVLYPVFYIEKGQNLFNGSRQRWKVVTLDVLRTLSQGAAQRCRGSSDKSRNVPGARRIFWRRGIHTSNSNWALTISLCAMQGLCLKPSTNRSVSMSPWS